MLRNKHGEAAGRSGVGQAQVTSGTLIEVELTSVNVDRRIYGATSERVRQGQSARAKLIYPVEGVAAVRITGETLRLLTFEPTVNRTTPLGATDGVPLMRAVWEWIGLEESVEDEGEFSGCSSRYGLGTRLN